MGKQQERPRRDYGSGSVYQRKSDGMWVGTIEAGWNVNGRRRRIPVYGKSEAVVKRKLRDRQRQIDREGPSTGSARTTVKTWAEQWLKIVERELGPSSYNATRSAVTRWIIPTIGHKRLELLTPADIRAVADAQRADGRASSTQRRTHSTLMGMLKAATLEGLPVPQRLLVTKAPAVGVNDRQDMSVPEALAVLEQAARLPHGSRYVAGLLQGMRQAECLGLTWDQVDLDAGVLTVSWQLKPLPYRIRYDRSSGFRVPDGFEAIQVKGALHLVRPKSKKGWRVIPLVPWMKSALRQWREIAPASPHGLVWPNLDGTPTYYKDDDEEWYALQGAAGVGHPGGRYYGIHECRHTTATLLLEAGVDPAVITAIIGHSSIVTTRGYQHVRTGPALDALTRVAARLNLSAERPAALESGE